MVRKYAEYAENVYVLKVIKSLSALNIFTRIMAVSLLSKVLICALQVINSQYASNMHAR